MRLPTMRTVQTNKVKKFAVAIAFSIFALPVQSAQLNGQFNVTVNLSTKATEPKSAFCRSSNMPGAFGATVTVVCATGVLVDISPTRTSAPFFPTHGGAYRYLFQVNQGGNLLGTVDSNLGVGTVTSWRFINLSDREYLEMLVNW